MRVKIANGVLCIKQASNNHMKCDRCKHEETAECLVGVCVGQVGLKLEDQRKVEEASKQHVASQTAWRRNIGEFAAEDGDGQWLEELDERDDSG